VGVEFKTATLRYTRDPRARFPAKTNLTSYCIPEAPSPAGVSISNAGRQCGDSALNPHKSPRTTPGWCASCQSRTIQRIGDRAARRTIVRDRERQVCESPLSPFRGVKRSLRRASANAETNRPHIGDRRASKAPLETQRQGIRRVAIELLLQPPPANSPVSRKAGDTKPRSKWHPAAACARRRH